MLGQIALVKGKHMPLVFGGSTDEEASATTEARSTRDDQGVALG